MVRRRQFIAGSIGLLAANANTAYGQDVVDAEVSEEEAPAEPLPAWMEADVEPGSAVFIAPSGTGTGLSWNDAAPLEAIEVLAAKVGAGGSINLLAGSTFALEGAVRLRNGGVADAPLTIRGLTLDGEPGKAVLRGTRTPWPFAPSESDAVDASAFAGNTLFRLAEGASHVVFEELSVGDAGIFLDMSGLAATDITVRDVDFHNLRDGIFTDGESEVSAVTIERFNGQGFSKKAIRFHGRCHDWRVIDCELDSRWQYGDNFAVGIEAHDAAHGLQIIGGSTINCMDMQGGDDDEYWNADGVATERGNYDILIRDHRSSGNTDAGYDLKSEATVLESCIAEDNKRNFRIWGGIGFDPTELRDCHSIAPRKRGGSGSTNHLWLSGADQAGGSAGSVLMTGGSISGGSQDNAIYADGGNVAVHLVDTEVDLPDDAAMFEASQKTSQVVIGSARDPELPPIDMASTVSVVEGLSKSLTLPDEHAATWRVAAEGKITATLVGHMVSLSGGDVGVVEPLILQVRDSAGRAFRRELAVEVIANPVRKGAVLALSIDAIAQHVSDATGLNDIVLSDEAQFQDGGFRFSGKSSYFEVTASENFVFSGAFALKARLRINLDRVSLPSDVVTLWKTSANDRSFRLGLTDAGEIAFFWSTSGKAEEGSVITGPVLDDDFHDVIVDRGASGIIRLYVDGTMVARTDAPVEALHNSPAPLRVSGRPDDKQGSQGILQSLLILNGVALCDSDSGCSE